MSSVFILVLAALLGAASTMVEAKESCPAVPVASIRPSLKELTGIWYLYAKTGVQFFKYIDCLVGDLKIVKNNTVEIRLLVLKELTDPWLLKFEALYEEGYYETNAIYLKLELPKTVDKASLVNYILDYKKGEYIVFWSCYRDWNNIPVQNILIFTREQLYEMKYEVFKSIMKKFEDWNLSVDGLHIVYQGLSCPVINARKPKMF